MLNPFDTRNINPVMLIRFLSVWLVQGLLTRGHLLWWPNGETHQSNIILQYINIYIYIWYHTISIVFIRENTNPAMLFGFGWPHVQGCCAENWPLHNVIYSGDQMGKLARVTYMQYISLQGQFSIAFVHVSDHFEHFLLCFFPIGPPLEWYETYVTPTAFMSLQRVKYAIYVVTYMGNTCIWPQHLIFMHAIYIAANICGHIYMGDNCL